MEALSFAYPIRKITAHAKVLDSDLHCSAFDFTRTRFLNTVSPIYSGRHRQTQLQHVVLELHNSGRSSFRHSRGEGRQAGKDTGALDTNSEPAHTVQVQAPPLRVALQREKTTHRPARQKLRQKRRLQFTPVAAGHALPEFKSGELEQSVKIAGQKHRGSTPTVGKSTRNLDWCPRWSWKAGNVQAPQFRARAAEKK